MRGQLSGGGGDCDQKNLAWIGIGRAIRWCNCCVDAGDHVRKGRSQRLRAGVLRAKCPMPDQQ